MAPGVLIEASPGSQRGQHYVPASGGRRTTRGQQELRVQTNEGRDAIVLYQIAEVSRPLTAVSQTCDNGNWVVYTPQGGFIWNLKTGGKTNFERRGGIYELDLWVKDSDLNGGSPSTGFPGRDITEQHDSRGGENVSPERCPFRLNVSLRMPA